jgi:hypothetical protein
LHNLAAAVLAIARRGSAFANASLDRSAVVKLTMLGAAVSMVVALLLVGLPAKPVAAQPLPTFSPVAPRADAQNKDTSLPLDVPFQVQFTKPMNESTVQSALTITPNIDLAYQWDATGQVLSLMPNPHWQPSTDYTVDISGNATDHEGLGLTEPIVASFTSGTLTSGQITATKTVGGLASPTTTFQVVFTRPVKLATVLARLSINPPVDASIIGDDPTDEASQVFTLTPKKPLETNTDYAVRLLDGGVDSAGANLQPVVQLAIKTLIAPSVVTITPQDGVYVYDTNQPISVQFSVAMDEKSGATALSVKANGRAVAGSTSWTENDTVLVFTPRHSFYIGSKISVRVAGSARSTGGLTMKAAASSAFTVSTPRSRRLANAPSKPIKTTKIDWTNGIASKTSPWHSAEVYYMSLMNCTRTGFWVTSAGQCSSQSHHTLPAQRALPLNSGISNRVSRPFAAVLAQRGVLSHNLDGTTPRSRMAAGGYSGCGGENISSPGNPRAGGMIEVELFFQSEYWNRGGHYRNIMNPHYRSAGVGVWVANGRTRVVIDFC